MIMFPSLTLALSSNDFVMYLSVQEYENYIAFGQTTAVSCGAISCTVWAKQETYLLTCYICCWMSGF